MTLRRMDISRGVGGRVVASPDGRATRFRRAWAGGAAPIGVPPARTQTGRNTRMTHLTTRAMALLMALSLVLAACGGDGESDDTGAAGDDGGSEDTAAA